MAAAIATLKDAGMGDQMIADLAGIGRSTANRWARGVNRPDHDPVQRLAARIWRRYPDVARELVEASGYPWHEPTDPDAEPLVDPEVAAVLRRRHPDDADELIAELERREARRRAGGEGRQAS